uniref:(northern house mosquito) hypothetical protein n=1 Tax=Culex pipiens TaxID=7175 RepID=A0A8D8J5B8_CULPI
MASLTYPSDCVPVQMDRLSDRALWPWKWSGLMAFMRSRCLSARLNPCQLRSLLMIGGNSLMMLITILFLSSSSSSDRYRLAADRTISSGGIRYCVSQPSAVSFRMRSEARHLCLRRKLRLTVFSVSDTAIGWPPHGADGDSSSSEVKSKKSLAGSAVGMSSTMRWALRDRRR